MGKAIVGLSVTSYYHNMLKYYSWAQITIGT